MDKTDLRKMMISRRDALSESERIKLSARIAKRLFSMKEYMDATIVLSYASFRSEVITDEINKKVIKDGKKLYLPKTYVKEHRMIFYRVMDPDSDLVTGAMGIPEPYTGADKFERDHLFDKILILMPCVAYDDSGNRLGYGGGFYDRFLSDDLRLTEHTILLAYEIQRAEHIPSEPNDIRPKLFLTE